MGDHLTIAEVITLIRAAFAEGYAQALADHASPYAPLAHLDDEPTQYIPLGLDNADTFTHPAIPRNPL